MATPSRCRWGPIVGSTGDLTLGFQHGRPQAVDGGASVFDSPWSIVVTSPQFAPHRARASTGALGPATRLLWHFLFVSADRQVRVPPVIRGSIAWSGLQWPPLGIVGVTRENIVEDGGR